MRKNAWILKVISLALVMGLTVGFLPPMQMMAADLPNADDGNVAVATPSVTSIKEKKLLPVDETQDFNALSVDDSLLLKISVDNFEWDGEAPPILTTNILAYSNISLGCSFITGEELFKAIEFSSDDEAVIELSFNGSDEGTSNEFEYTVYLKQNDIIAEGTKTTLKGNIFQNPLSIRTFDTFSAQNSPGIFAGSGYSAAVEQDGNLWAWGNLYVLSSGAKSTSSNPVKVSDNVASVSFGWDHNMILKKDSSLWASGAPDNGKLGDGGNGNDPTRLIPFKVLEDVASVSAGRYHTIAIKQDSSLWAWGINTSGHLGIGTSDFYKSTPVEVPLDNVVSISVGNEHSMAIKQDGSLWAWGRNNYGQLGDGTDALKRSPINVLDDVASVSAGGDHTMAIKLDGSLWACGDNQYGQIDNGATDIHYSFFKLADDVAFVSAGRFHTMAIKQDGSLWAWGRNNYGQLGDGTTIDKSSPIKVLDNVDYVSAGENNTIVIKNDGSRWAWGRNNIGQLGDGTTIDRLSPVEILDFDDSQGGNPGTTDFFATDRFPVNGQTNVSQACVIEATFNSFILGDITGIFLKKFNDDSIVNADITKNEDKLRITPESALELDTKYYVTVPANSIYDGSNNYFIGWPKGDYTFTTTDSSSDQNINIKFRSDVNTNGLSWDFTYNDDFFSNASNIYNHNLAKISLGVAIAGFSPNDTDANWDLDGEYGRNRNVSNALMQMGFKEYQSYNYDISLNDRSSKVAFSIAEKPIIVNGTRCTIVSVVIRGGGYGAEWADNTFVGDNRQYHRGFDESAEKVVADIRKYITDMSIPDDFKIWITSYSRGAAVANLAAAKLNDLYMSTNNYSKEKVYAYTFATPQGSLANKSFIQGASFNNIFNIINPYDTVPCVALSDWGFSRYGVDLSMDMSHTTTSSAALVANYAAITNRSYPDFTSNLSNTNNLLKRIRGLIPNTSMYEQKWQNAISDMLSLVNYKYKIDQGQWDTNILTTYRKVYPDRISSLMKAATSNLSPIVNLFSSEELDYFIAFYGLFIEHNGDGFAPSEVYNLFKIVFLDVLPGSLDEVATAHYPEVYLAWMISYNDANLFKNSVYQRVNVDCPVDVNIYDSGNNLVASVIGNQIIQNSIPIQVIDDHKEFYLIDGIDNYRIELLATDNGEMQYSVTEFSSASHQEIRKVNYYNVNLIKDMVFTGDVDGGTSNNTYDLISELNGVTTPLTPDEELSRNSLNDVQITVTTLGNGIAVGTQLVSKGDYVLVQADTDTDSSFDGWYENNLIVSDNNDYAFLATSSRNLEARFVSASSQTYTITATAGTGGSVSGGGTFNECTTVNLIATADSGYAFDGWYESGSKVTGAAATYSFDATADRTLEARFVLISSSTTYTITAIAGMGGSVSGGGIFNENAAVTLIATPNSGYFFDAWYENGAKIDGASATYSFIATRSRALEAKFIADSNGNTTDSSDRNFSSNNSRNNTSSSQNTSPDPLASLLTRIKSAVETVAKDTLIGQPVKAIVQIKNANKITLAMLKQAAGTAKKAGGSVTLHFDTMSSDGKTVLTRIYVKPELATRDIILSANEVRAENVKNLFEKYFKNKIAVVSFDQQGSFGMPVEVATKVDLTGMDTENLFFYSYSKETNSYTRIKEPKYRIDKNSYLHFVTELAGDIIISDGPLENK